MGTQTPTADSSKTASTPRIALKTMIVSLLPAVGDVSSLVLLLGGVGDDASSAKLYKPFCGKCIYKVYARLGGGGQALLSWQPVMVSSVILTKMEEPQTAFALIGAHQWQTNGRLGGLSASISTTSETLVVSIETDRGKLQSQADCWLPVVKGVHGDAFLCQLAD